MSARLWWFELTRRNKPPKLLADHLPGCCCGSGKWGKIALKSSRRRLKSLEEEAGDVVGIGAFAAEMLRAAELANYGQLSTVT
jgi:hypothetical protein